MPDARPPIEMVKGVPVVAPPEETEASHASWWRAVLLQGAWFAVDMTRTQFFDPAAIGARVIPAGATVLRALALTGLDQMIPNATGLDQALEPELAAVPPPTPIGTARKPGDAHLRRPAADRSWRRQTRTV